MSIIEITLFLLFKFLMVVCCNLKCAVSFLLLSTLLALVWEFIISVKTCENWLHALTTEIVFEVTEVHVSFLFSLLQKLIR